MVHRRCRLANLPFRPEQQPLIRGTGTVASITAEYISYPDYHAHFRRQVGRLWCLTAQPRSTSPTQGIPANFKYLPLETLIAVATRSSEVRPRLRPCPFWTSRCRSGQSEAREMALLGGRAP